MVKDPILRALVQKISANVPQQLQRAFNNAINDGLKIMHDPKTHNLMVQQLRESPNMQENVGQGAAKIVAMLINVSKGKLPMKALVPAGVVIMCEGLQFVADAGQIQITNDTVAETYKAFMSALMQLLHITPEKLQQVIAQAAQKNGAPQAPQAAPQQPAPQGVIGQQMGA